MDNNHQSITKSAQETAEVGRKLAVDLKGRDGGPFALCLYGELGSGKTTFTQGFAKGLGITTRLLSPTFIIVRRYDIPSSENFLYHMDLYRLKGDQDMEELGLTEILTDPGSVAVIEWAEKLGDMLPKRRLDIHLAVQSDGAHTISVRNVIT